MRFLATAAGRSGPEGPTIAEFVSTADGNPVEGQLDAVAGFGVTDEVCCREGRCDSGCRLGGAPGPGRWIFGLVALGRRRYGF